MMDKNYYKILRSITGTTYHVPIYLDSKGYEMGGMVGFEGDIEQVDLPYVNKFSNGLTIVIEKTE